MTARQPVRRRPSEEVALEQDPIERDLALRRKRERFKYRLRGKTRLSVDVEPELMSAIRTEAAGRGLTINALVVFLLESGLKK